MEPYFVMKLSVQKRVIDIQMILILQHCDIHYLFELLIYTSGYMDTFTMLILAYSVILKHLNNHDLEHNLILQYFRTPELAVI